MAEEKKATEEKALNGEFVAPNGGEENHIVTDEKYLIKDKIHRVSWKYTPPKANDPEARTFWTANFVFEGHQTFCIVEGSIPKGNDGFYVENIRENGEFEGRQGEMINKVGLKRANFKGWNMNNQTPSFREKMEVLKNLGLNPTFMTND